MTQNATIQRRTRRQLDAAGETSESIRRALDDHDKRRGWPDPDTWFDMQRAMVDELAIVEGRMFPNTIDFIDR